MNSYQLIINAMRKNKAEKCTRVRMIVVFEGAMREGFSNEVSEHRTERRLGIGRESIGRRAFQARETRAGPAVELLCED